MKGVELYGRVRRYVLVDGFSRREAARIFGIDRETVAKMLKHAVPPGYRRDQVPRKPKIDPYRGVIDHILETDREKPRKQRHTAERIFQRLRAEHGYTGGKTIVKDYVQAWYEHTREAFVPLLHEPGHAQADFGEAVVVIAGKECKAHFFALDCPHSDAGFVNAYPAETTEAFCDGHVQAFAFLGGVPRSILYDNTKIAVANILGDGRRKRTKTFGELVSHYLFADRFGRVRKGNDKGNVENLVKFAQRRYFTPIPQAASWDDLNKHLRDSCIARMSDHIRDGGGETIAARLERDRHAFLPLPAVPYDACQRVPGHARSTALVRYMTNDYSVPVAYAHRDVLIRVYVHEIVICHGAAVIARHRRSYERNDEYYNPLHYLTLLERKPGALDQAAPLAGWDLPEGFLTLRRLLEARLGKAGRREFIQVLMLINTFSLELVNRGVLEALRLSAISYDAIKHLIIASLERRVVKLDLDAYPHLPRADVLTTKAADYNALLLTESTT
jgi:transposase